MALGLVMGLCGAAISAALVFLCVQVWELKDHLYNPIRIRRRGHSSRTPLLQYPTDEEWTLKDLLTRLLNFVSVVRANLKLPYSYRRLREPPTPPRPQTASVWKMSAVPEVTFVSSSAPDTSLPEATSVDLTGHGKGFRSPRIAGGTLNTPTATSEAHKVTLMSSLGNSRATITPPMTQHIIRAPRDSRAYAGGFRAIQMTQDPHAIDGVARAGTCRTYCTARIHGQSLERLREDRTKAWVQSLGRVMPYWEAEEGRCGQCEERYRLMDQWDAEQREWEWGGKRWVALQQVATEYEALKAGEVLR